jgi:protein-tyrosine phosphatase
VRELVDLSCNGTIRLALAHIDRYQGYVNRSDWVRLREHGVLMQINADSLLRFGTRHKMLRLLKDGTAQLLGSDCHNLSDRLPRMQQACTVIENSLGKDFLCQMHDFAGSLLA